MAVVADESARSGNFYVAMNPSMALGANCHPKSFVVQQPAHTSTSMVDFCGTDFNWGLLPESPHAPRILDEKEFSLADILALLTSPLAGHPADGFAAGDHSARHSAGD